MSRQPFTLDRYDLPRTPGGLALEPVDDEAARRIAGAVAGMDPWCTLTISADKLAQTLMQGDAHLHRWIIRSGTADAGAVIIRSPWLYGPYLALLAVTPEHQGAGVGKAILQWMENESRGTATNIWACVSAFNVRARHFYEQQGFETVGALDDLVRPGFAEVLIRKRVA